MASAGTVTLNLDANSVKLLRELQRTETSSRRTAGRMAQDFRRSFARIAKAAAVMATAVAGATAAIVRSQSRQIDELGKTSDALGVTVQNMQALRHVADLSGVSSDRLTTSMQRMQRSLGEAARRGGATADALREIGIEVKDIINLSADQQMEELAQALAKVENQTIRASIASDLFGRSGLQMLNTLDALAKDGIDGVRAELEALGFALDRQGVAKVEAMNNSLNTMQLISRGAGQTLTVALSPFIQEVADRLTDAAKASGGFKTEISAAIDATVRRVAFLADAAFGLRQVFRLVGRAAATQALVMERAMFGIAHAIINGPVRAVNLMIRGINQMLRQLERIPLLRIDAPQIAEIATPLADALKNRVQTLTLAIQEAVTDMQMVLMEDLPSVGVLKALEEVKRKADEAAEVVANSVRVSGDMIDTDEMVEQLEDTTNKMSEFSRQAARNIQTSFADFLFNPFEDGLKGMLKSFVNTLRRMVAEAAAANILGSIGGALAGSANPILGAIGGFFGGARAAGGPVTGGKAYLVGERGPELVVPGSSGTVVPNNAMGGLNQTINIPLAFPQELEAYVRNVAGPAGRDAAMQIMRAQGGRF